jgi:hypothetical protein
MAAPRNLKSEPGAGVTKGNYLLGRTMCAASPLLGTAISTTWQPSAQLCADPERRRVTIE